MTLPKPEASPLDPLATQIAMAGDAPWVALVRGPDHRVAEVFEALDASGPLVCVGSALDLPLVPPGSLVLAGVDEPSARWLNAWRNAIRTARLRAVLWMPDSQAFNLRQIAPDLDSWVGTWIPLAPAAPRWVVDAMRAEPGGPFVWTGPGWEAAIQGLEPESAIVELEPPRDPRTAIPDGWVVYRCGRREEDAVRALRHLAWHERSGHVIVVADGLDLPGFTPIDPTVLPWQEAVRRLAAAGVEEAAREAARLGCAGQEIDRIERGLDGRPTSTPVALSRDERDAWREGGPSDAPARWLPIAKAFLALGDGAFSVAILETILGAPAAGSDLVVDALLELPLALIEAGHYRRAVDAALRAVTHLEAFGSARGMLARARLVQARIQAGAARGARDDAIAAIARAAAVGAEELEILELKFQAADAEWAYTASRSAIEEHERVLATLRGRLGEQDPLTVRSVWRLELLREAWRGAMASPRAAVRPGGPTPGRPSEGFAFWREIPVVDALVLETLLRAHGVWPKARPPVMGQPDPLIELDSSVDPDRDPPRPLDLLARQFGADHPGVLAARAVYPTYLAFFGDHRSALQVMEDILDRQLRVVGPSHPDVVRSLLRCAAIAASASPGPEAAQLADRAHRAAREVFAPAHPLRLIATALRDAFHGGAAVSSVAGAFKRARRFHGDEHWVTAVFAMMLHFGNVDPAGPDAEAAASVIERIRALPENESEPSVRTVLSVARRWSRGGSVTVE